MTIKTGIIILCRYNSSRLPGKILKKINGKEILLYIIERIKKINPRLEFIVATSEEISDEPIIQFCSEHNIKFFRGSLNNVADRFLQCALQYNLDFAFRINGDNLLLDIDLLKNCLDIAQTNQFDFISNVDNRTFPKGMSVEAIRTEIYKKEIENFSEYDKEHVMTYFYRNIQNFKHHFLYNHEIPELAGYQIAVDTQDDLELMHKIILEFTNDHTQYGLKEIFQILKKLDKI